ncbi:MAG: hypothetical protein A4E68_02030 [Syntrophaceae bacterium PtaB.Bin095]|nr:MAG: hypothetical protein A4E68_02030 [Syntrophaceae bacterium PtaB.Bin095]
MEKGKPVLHGAHEDDDAEDGPHGKAESQVPDFPDSGGGGGVFLKLVENAEKFVAQIGDGLLQARHAIPGLFMENGGPGCSQIDRHILHAADGFQGVLHAAHAGGAGHSADGDRRFIQPPGNGLIDPDDLVPQFPDLFAKLLRLDRSGIEVHDGLLGGEIDRGLLHAGHFPQSLLHAAHTGSAGHPRDMKDRLIRQLRTPLQRFSFG